MTRTVLRPAGPESTRFTRLALAAGMASLLDSAAIITVGSSLPLWRSGLGLGDWSVGAISSSFTLFIAVGALLGGRLADRVGRARVFAATVGVYLAGALLLVVAPSAAAVVVGAMVLGVASGADLPASIALVAERTPPELRGRMVALTQVMWGVGILVATVMALAVSSLALPGVRISFAVLALGALGTLLVRRRVLATSEHEAAPVERPGPAGAGEAGEARTGRANRRLQALVAAFYLVYTLVSNTFGSFRTYFLVVVGGVGQTIATTIALAVTVVGLAGSLVFSVLADTPWRKRIYPAGSALFVAAQLLLALTGGQPLLVVVVALTAYSVAYPFVGEALYKVWTQELVSSDLRATFQGATIALARTGAAAFALVTPTLMSWSPAGLFWIVTAAAVTASLLGWRVSRQI